MQGLDVRFRLIHVVSMTSDEHIAIVGGGVGGLAAAIALASGGARVSVFERQSVVGGKMRVIDVAGSPVDAGPTVLTMPWVFEHLFDRSGARLRDYVKLDRSAFLGRHVWPDGSTLDLHADAEASEQAVGTFAGAAEARAFRTFVDDARRIHNAVQQPFLLSPRPTMLSLFKEVAKLRGAVMDVDVHRTMHAALSRRFRDQRLIQLFGRYATYCGSSPYRAPATLNVIYHVESQGVWFVRGGMRALAEALRLRAEELGVSIHCNCHVERIELAVGRARGLRLIDGRQVRADAVVVNADANAIAMGLLGRGVSRAVPLTPPSDRSLSALTFAVTGTATGFPLLRHTVFFSSDYAREFAEIERDDVASEPTAYLCAQDRDDSGLATHSSERLLIVINASARGESRPLSTERVDNYRRNLWSRLHRSGLNIRHRQVVATTPSDFERLYPATGGALYGKATHGPLASLSRPGSRTTVPGLYLAGGSTHPGAGVPMAAISGWLCAMSVQSDLILERRRSRVAIAGSISTA